MLQVASLLKLLGAGGKANTTASISQQLLGLVRTNAITLDMLAETSLLPTLARLLQIKARTKMAAQRPRITITCHATS